MPVINKLEANKLEKKITQNVISLDIPLHFLNAVDTPDSTTNWVGLNHPLYDGEVKVSTNSQGYISSIEVRGELASHISQDMLINHKGFELIDLSDPESITMGLNNDDDDIPSKPDEWLWCVAGCAKWGGYQPLAIIICGIACAVEA